jgi:hypothetical protein
MRRIIYIYIILPIINKIIEPFLVYIYIRKGSKGRLGAYEKTKNFFFKCFLENLFNLPMG